MLCHRIELQARSCSFRGEGILAMNTVHAPRDGRSGWAALMFLLSGGFAAFFLRISSARFPSDAAAPIGGTGLCHDGLGDIGLERTAPHCFQVFRPLAFELYCAQC